MGGGAEAGEGGEVARDCVVTPVRIVSLFHPHHSLYCLGAPTGQLGGAAVETAGFSFRLERQSLESLCRLLSLSGLKRNIRPSIPRLEICGRIFRPSCSK